MHDQPSARYLAVLALLVMATLAPLAGASQPPSPPEIVFFQEHGHKTTTDLVLNGSSNFPLRDTSWSIVDLGTTTPVVLLSGPYMTSVTPIDDGRFMWTLDINVTGLSCVCYLDFTPETGLGVGESFRLAIYIGEDSDHLPVLFNDFPGEYSSVPVTDQAPISQGWVNVSYRSVMSGNSWNSAQVVGHICEAPQQVCLEESVPISVANNVGANAVDFMVDLREADLEDGVWLLHFMVIDQVLRPSNTMKHLVILDTTEPILTLAAPNIVPERAALHAIAHVDDGYSGAFTTATWSLIYNNQTLRSLESTELIDEHHAILNLSVSGHYELQVLVRDRAGYTTISSHEFVVENLRPNAFLTLDGLELQEGQTVVVEPTLNWSILADERSDNEPVEYLWVIDNSTSVRGAQQLSAETLSGLGVYNVELIVFDDDGSTDRITVTINILNQPSEVSSGNDLYLWGGVGVLVVLITGFMVMIRRGFDADELPKWSKRTRPNDEAED